MVHSGGDETGEGGSMFSSTYICSSVVGGLDMWSYSATAEMA